MYLETVMRERESLGKWLADKVTSINIYFDGFPHFMSMAPRDDRKHIMHHCRQKVDACDWIMCGAIRHWIHRWKLSEWATSAYLVHDMTVGQLGNGLSQLRFPRYSSPDSLSNHDCAPLGMSDDFLVAIVNQRLETLKGLKLNLSH